MYNVLHWSYRSADKGQKLKEARELQLFEQEVEDIEDWIADMEHQLASEDLGKDLISVNSLLKSYQVRIAVKGSIFSAGERITMLMTDAGEQHSGTSRTNR